MANARGYTLLELLIVLAIIGLIAALATPMAASAIENATLRADARTLTSTLRKLQHDAIAEQRTVAIAQPDKTELPTAFADDAIDPNARIAIAGGQIEYFADGTTSGGGVTLTEGRRTLNISVAWLTGDITIEDAP